MQTDKNNIFRSVINPILQKKKKKSYKIKTYFSYPDLLKSHSFSFTRFRFSKGRLWHCILGDKMFIFF